MPPIVGFKFKIGSRYGFDIQINQWRNHDTCIEKKIVDLGCSIGVVPPHKANGVANLTITRKQQDEGQK